MATYVLALETATDTCSVALADADRILVDLTLYRPRLHAERLVPLIQAALRQAGLRVSDLSVIAVSSGPGSYTGLRIGVSTAKGLAAATGAMLVAVPSLEALARAVAPFAAPGDTIAAAFNARRNEVYIATFRRAADDDLHPLAETAALTTTDVPDWLGPTTDGTLWLVGEGAARLMPVLANAGRAARPMPPEAVAPSARPVARLGWARYKAGQVEDLAAFEPHYLKEFIAKKPSASVFEKLSF